MKRLQFTKRDALYLIIIGVLVLGLVAALVLPALLKKNEEQPAPIYYEIKCDAFHVQNANLSHGQIVFIGDSITDLYPLDQYYADLPLASYNRGISGDTTGGVLDRLSVSAYELAPSKIVLMIGTNDINGSDTVEKIAERYEQILSKLRAELPSTEIYCISVIPQNEDLEAHSTINVAKSTERIHTLNDKIEAMCPTYAATYLDLYPLLADENDRLIHAYSDDGIHLNAAGFAVWTALLKPHLQ